MKTPRELFRGAIDAILFCSAKSDNYISVDSGLMK